MWRAGERRNVCRDFVGDPEGKTPHRRRVCRWEGDIKMDLTEIGWEGGDCVHGPGEGWVVSSSEHGKQTLEHHKMSGIS